MVGVLDRVIRIAEYHSGLKNLCATSSLAHDIRTSGDDIDEFAEALWKEFGGDVASWPWHRFANMNEPHILTGLLFIWRLVTWPIRGRIFDPVPYERLQLGHIAAVIEKGEWFEP